MISVIIPTYNRHAKTRNAVQSVQAQLGFEPADIEIVVVDDASQSPFIHEQDTGPYSVRVHRLERNGGAARARNAGIQAAKGEFIALLDSDDVWLPDKLSQQVSRHEKCVARGISPTRLVVACGFYIGASRNDKLEARMPIDGRDVATFAAGCWHCPGSTFFAHRSVFEMVGALDTNLLRLEDLDWFLRFGIGGGVLETASVYGAVIAPSGEAQYDTVGQAVQQIEDKYSHLVAEGKLDRAAYRQLRAYCELELCAAAVSAGKKTRAVRHLSQSQILAPRPRSAVKRFWHRSPVHDEGVRALYQRLRELDSA